MIIKNSEASVTVVDQIPDWARTAEPIQATDDSEDKQTEEPAKED